MKIFRGILTLKLCGTNEAQRSLCPNERLVSGFFMIAIASSISAMAAIAFYKNGGQSMYEISIVVGGVVVFLWLHFDRRI